MPQSPLDPIAEAFRRILVVIPIRDLETAKSRLGEALDPEERQELVLRLLFRTIGAAKAARNVADAVVVSPDIELLGRCVEVGSRIFHQGSYGLNKGLAEGRAWVTAHGGSGMLILPADLPAVSGELIDDVVERARELAELQVPTYEAGIAVLVPDRRGDGTNALLAVPPNALPFDFGPGSRQRHRAAAAARNTLLSELESPLSLDIDTPDDLLFAEEAGFLGAGV